MRWHCLRANLYEQGMNGEICTEAFDDLGFVFREISDEARGQRSDVFQGKFWWPELLFIQTSRVVFCYMILPYFATSHTPLQKSLVYTVMPTSGDLKSGDLFFRPAPPPCNQICWWDSPPQKISFLFASPTPHPPEQCCKKNMDLSVRDLNRLNTHPIRLSLILDWQRKDSLLFVCNEQHVSCKKMKPETVIQA